MRKFCIWVLFIAVLFTGCQTIVKPKGPWVKKIDSEELSKLVINYSIKLKKEHHLDLEDSWVSYDDFIKKICIKLSSQRLLTVEEGRLLIVEVVEELLYRINNHSVLSFELGYYPMTAKDLDIRINFESFHGRYVDELYLGQIWLQCSCVHFYAFDRKDSNIDWDHHRFEPYFKSRELALLKKEADLPFTDKSNISNKVDYPAYERYEKYTLGKVRQEKCDNFEPRPFTIIPGDCVWPIDERFPIANPDCKDQYPAPVFETEGNRGRGEIHPYLDVTNQTAYGPAPMAVNPQPQSYPLPDIERRVDNGQYVAPTPYVFPSPYSTSDYPYSEYPHLHVPTTEVIHNDNIPLTIPNPYEPNLVVPNQQNTSIPLPYETSQTTLIQAPYQTGNVEWTQSSSGFQPSYFVDRLHSEQPAIPISATSPIEPAQFVDRLHSEQPAVPISTTSPIQQAQFVDIHHGEHPASFTQSPTFEEPSYFVQPAYSPETNFAQPPYTPNTTNIYPRTDPSDL